MSDTDAFVILISPLRSENLNVKCLRIFLYCKTHGALNPTAPLSFSSRTHKGCDQAFNAEQALLNRVSTHAPIRGATRNLA